MTSPAADDVKTTMTLACPTDRSATMSAKTTSPNLAFSFSLFGRRGQGALPQDADVGGRRMMRARQGHFAGGGRKRAHKGLETPGTASSSMSHLSHAVWKLGGHSPTPSGPPDGGRDPESPQSPQQSSSSPELSSKLRFG
eukprot:CAMPEP_0206050108 /NCGR_PEP_ID=MMETSP1466-20131121/28406_1 /ASSEMBLY_ACC=CAM_ASM_001126 /TAXON_ID=44452 /ORGANISM="Pavlova gyrans, Strain CCMP608" /LENGTH=139 /DNA_ID=CAMNT_0053425215 /DNA_START=188 /DNA_END=611 /DNA_ORIENTATION=+